MKGKFSFNRECLYLIFKGTTRYSLADDEAHRQVFLLIITLSSKELKVAHTVLLTTAG